LDDSLLLQEIRLKTPRAKMKILRIKRV